MSPCNNAVELLAQAIYFGFPGMTTVDARWKAYAEAYPSFAERHREDARKMIDAAKKARAGNQFVRTSVDWLLDEELPP